MSICLLLGCGEKVVLKKEDRKMRAEQLFNSVYGGDISRIDSLVAEEVYSTYPVYEQLFGQKAIRGRKAYKDFAIGFGERWSNAKITVDDAISEDENVVLVWSFSATKRGTTPDSSFVDGREYSWGGITLFKFDASGKIIAEIGEESTPGPYGRIKE